MFKLQVICAILFRYIKLLAVFEASGPRIANEAHRITNSSSSEPGHFPVDVAPQAPT